jgi:molybdenum cofactor biosynthesis enzyme MoaA
MERWLNLAIGADLGDATIEGFEVGANELLVDVVLTTGERVRFSVAGSRAPATVGPFSALPELSYRKTEVPFARFEGCGRALARVIRAGLGDREVRTAVDPLLSPPPPADWREALERLLDRADDTVALGPWLDAELGRARPCTLPWTHLELGSGARFGPCCSDFQQAPASAAADLLALYRSEPMRAFRRALSGGAPHDTCRATCPRLLARSDSLEQMVLRGGPRSFVDNQRRIVEAIIAGDDDPPCTPLELVFPTTSFCNYDCLMCRFGEDGTLEDELPPSFYHGLEPLLPGLRQLQALGGEPLASPVFREFLAGPALRAHPHVAISLVTNGSYLTPAEQARYHAVRFEHLTISLNAATESTYAAVNRGLPLARVRSHLDSLLVRHRTNQWPRAITYSMVLLRSNLHEIEAFAALARTDGVGVRFMLPMLDRNHQSFLTDAGLMRDVEQRLRAVATSLGERDAHRARGEAAVLRARIDRGVLRTLPD